MVDLVKQKMDAYNSLLDEYLEKKKVFEDSLPKKNTPKKEKPVEVVKEKPAKKEAKPNKQKDTTIG